MVAGATPQASPIGTGFPQPAAASAQASYNPAPPVKPVAKSAGCMGVLAGVISLSAVLALLAVACLR
jgi:hypothetical protein